jgi:recombination protein RecR
MPLALQHFVQHLSRLPGLGPRSARRLALSLLKHRESQLQPLITHLTTLAQEIIPCSYCGNLDHHSPCSLCQDPARANGQLCIVGDLADLWALERAGIYHGQYFVLGGYLSSLAGRGPDLLGVDKLLARFTPDPLPPNAPLPGGHKTPIEEVILALAPSLEGQTTSHYVIDKITQKLSQAKLTNRHNDLMPPLLTPSPSALTVKFTRLAQGIPMGGELDYLDDGTLSAAFLSRRPLPPPQGL